MRRIRDSRRPADMRALLALPLALALAALLPRAHGAAACTDCSGQVCILDGTATSVAGGATALTLSMCNFDASALSASDLSFGALYPPACDAENATFPVATALTAADGCTADACSVTVTLESGLDWALALHGASGVNAITAELVNGSGKSEVVTVGTFQDVAGAAMVSTTESVSVCATKIPISASRLSYVDKCNVAQLCQGAAADTSCTTALQQNLYVADVSCQSETCTGNLTLTSSLPCDGSSGDATSLIVAVQVATSTISNYLSVGAMVATNFTISAAEGVDVGSSEIVLTTDTFCEASSVNLSLAYGSTSASGSSADTIEFSSLNTTSNGTIVVELSSPLKESLEGEGLTFSLSQCGITASAFTATVGAGSSSSDEDDSASDSTDGSDNDINNSAETGSEGTAQESDSSTGLSGGLYVGIGIGVVAFLGFVGECYIHKRRQAKQPAATNPNPATATIGYANTM